MFVLVCQFTDRQIRLVLAPKQLPWHVWNKRDKSTACTYLDMSTVSKSQNVCSNWEPIR